jgi:hypothetical protein
VNCKKSARLPASKPRENLHCNGIKNHFASAVNVYFFTQTSLATLRKTTSRPMGLSEVREQIPAPN